MSLTIIFLFSVSCIAQNVPTVYGLCRSWTNESINSPIYNNDTNRKPCVAKCCPDNQVLYKHRSAEILCGNVNDTTFDYTDVKIYVQHEQISDIKMERSDIIYSKNFADLGLSVDIRDIFDADFPSFESEILENGTLLIITESNDTVMELQAGMFCIEYQIDIEEEKASSKKKLMIRIASEPITEEDRQKLKDNKVIYTSSGMLVSCVFLLLVLAVYSVLPQLRNLAGMMLMAYVTTLTIAFLFRAVSGFGMENQALDSTACRYVGLIYYFSVLASFTWMNAMSFDIWWSMRGFRKLRQIHRRGILVKFGWYSLYGWGVPLVPMLFIIIVDHMDLSSMPGFIKPGMFLEEQCFMAENERLIYMNGPILITTCINIALFLMTAYNIWRIKREVTQHKAGESRRNKKDEMRFIIYLKLSLVMGITWILEVASSFYYPNSKWWYLPDALNCLSGVFIFIIFVCKRRVIALLCKRFSIENELVQKWEPVDSIHTVSSGLSRRRKMQESFITDTSDVDDEKKGPTKIG